MTKQTVRVNLYAIVERAVECGVQLGWRHGFKHRDDEPERPEDVRERLVVDVMQSLSEVIDFGPEFDVV